jgi:hypothetical protein
VSKEESLMAGRRIRITSQQRSHHLVTGIMLLN